LVRSTLGDVSGELRSTGRDVIRHHAKYLHRRVADVMENGGIGFGGYAAFASILQGTIQYFCHQLRSGLRLVWSLHRSNRFLEFTRVNSQTGMGIIS
jgi:hypothetical protein